MIEKNIFLDENQAKEFRDKIKSAGKTEKEAFKKGPLYTTGRVERGANDPLSDIQGVHGFSILDIIEKELNDDEQFKRRKFKILDMGGGIGAFADQIRDNFGDRVKVFTTGLVKNPVREVRKKRPFYTAPELKDDFPSNYLKWRSILELNKIDESGEPLEEFDLIINTYGEIPYGQKGDERWLEIYIEAIIKKLRPGGIASIAPAGGWYEKQKGGKSDKFVVDETKIQKIMERLQTMFKNIQITLSHSNKKTPVLLIQ